MKHLKLCLATSIAFSSLLSAASLSNEEIDKIFISYEQEKKEKEKALAEKKKKEKAQMKKMMAPPASMFSSRNILPHGGSGVLVHGKSTKMGGMPPLSPIGGGMAMAPLQLKGIICEKKRCRAITNKGIVRAGHIFQDGEKVKSISSTTLVTNYRKLSF